MRNKLLALTFLLLGVFSVTQAQETAMHQVIVPLTEGGFVAFKNLIEPAGTENTSAGSPSANVAFRPQVLIGDNHVLHRMLADTTGRFVFGYDLLVTPNPVSRQFKIAVRPLDPRFESALRTRNAGEQSSRPDVIPTFPKAVEPQTLNDGDAFTLDLLINRDTGVKIVDVVKVSFDRTGLSDVNPKMLARDFTPDAVELSVKNYRLLIDGNVIATARPNIYCTGTLIWLYVEDRGRFIFSLVPREGYPFQKVGIIEDNKIEFTLKGERYEWISGAPILRDGGTWNLWVLHDEKYTPWTFNAGQDPAEHGDKWSKLDLDAAAKKAEASARQARDQKQRTFEQGATDQTRATRPLRVTIGGADRIENLWPRQ